MVLSRLWVNIKQGECNTIVFINRSWLSKFFRGFRQKFGGQLWGREKIKAKN